MKSKITMFISITIMVFILATIGSMVHVSSAAQKIENNTLKSNLAQLKDQYATREASFNALIDEANQNILNANQNMETLSTQIKVLEQHSSHLQPVVPTAAPVSIGDAAADAAPIQYPVSSDAALQNAKLAAWKDAIQSNLPELVQFQGKPAYEVPFDTGSIYIDANTAEVLYNGTLPREISKEEAGQIALDYLKGVNKIYQIDKITVNGKILWRTIVAAGHMVYEDSTGQVVYVQIYDRQAALAAATTSSSGGGPGSGESSSKSSGGGDQGGDGGDD